MREKRLEAYALCESLPMPHTTKDDVWRRTVDMRTQDYWRRTRRHLRGFALEKYHPNAPTNGKLIRRKFRLQRRGNSRCACAS